MLSRVYRAVALQSVDQIRYNIIVLDWKNCVPLVIEDTDDVEEEYIPMTFRNCFFNMYNKVR
jgi:hypothetical protein